MKKIPSMRINIDLAYLGNHKNNDLCAWGKKKRRRRRYFININITINKFAYPDFSKSLYPLKISRYHYYINSPRYYI